MIDLAILLSATSLRSRKGLKDFFLQDINRAESYGKRMQKEFEREYETVGICQDIISASEEGEEEEKVEEESDSEHKSILSERENVQNGDNNKDVPSEEGDGSNANQDEKSDVEAEKEKTNSKSILLTEEIMSSSFQVSATTDPFGL